MRVSLSSSRCVAVMEIVFPQLDAHGIQVDRANYAGELVPLYEFIDNLKCLDQEALEQGRMILISWRIHDVRCFKRNGSQGQSVKQA